MLNETIAATAERLAELAARAYDADFDSPEYEELDAEYERQFNTAVKAIAFTYNELEEFVAFKLNVAVDDVFAG